MLSAMNSGRGWHSQFFFVRDLGLALASKVCPDQSQTFKEVNNRLAFTGIKKKKMTHLFFWTSRSQVLQGMSVQSFAQKIEDLTA